MAVGSQLIGPCEGALLMLGRDWIADNLRSLLVSSAEVGAKGRMVLEARVLVSHWLELPQLC